MPFDHMNHTFGEGFLRLNPFDKFENDGKSLRELIITLGKKLEAGELTDEDLVVFFRSHKLVVNG